MAIESSVVSQRGMFSGDFTAKIRYLKFMHRESALSLIQKIKYNPFSSFLYRKYFIRRALRSGEPELHALPLLVSPGRLALDIGSNKGAYSYLLANMGVSTHAFEPQPEFCDRLIHTAPSNLVCHNVAVSDREGEMDFYLPVKKGRVLNQLATLRNISDRTECKKISVRTCTLDNLGFTNIGFIKIDVEGWERQIIQGGINTIRRDKPTMLIEIEERHTETELADSLSFIESLGYKAHCYHEHRIQPITEFFDIDRHHRFVGTGRYYNNFIFIPC